MKTLIEIRTRYEGMFKKPDIDPWFPEDITLTTEDDLGKLITLYTLWKNHISEQVSIDDAEALILKEELELARAEEMVKLNEDENLKSVYSAKEDRVAYVISRKRVSTLMKQEAELFAILKIEKAVLENMESRYNAVSREITRRAQRWN